MSERVFVRKTFKYKMMPTPEQEQALEMVLWRCRSLYNVALEQRKVWWARGQGKIATYLQQKAELPDLKDACPEFAEINAQVLQDVILRVDRSFQGFFRRVKSGQTPGYPRFQGSRRYNSFTYPQYGGYPGYGGAALDGGVLNLSKIGRISIRIHRPLEGMPKTVTVSREADGWYACFSCVDVPCRPLPRADQETGIDLGLESFATLADGRQVANPRIFRIAEMSLKRAQRRVSRRTKESNRRRKAVKLLAKVHQHVRRSRADFHHKTALALVRQYDLIYHEDLRTANLLRNRHLAKSIADAGWGAFLSILSFKAACASRKVIAVDPAFTSQACSGCGVTVQKGLSVRWHLCPECGTSLHRDQNAALNIFRRGKEQTSAVGQTVQALTWPNGRA